MKKLNKMVVVGTMILAMGATSMTAFASDYTSPSDAVAGLTGRTAESVMTERTETGKTYGTIAGEAGKLDEFKLEMFDIKSRIINSMVESGKITQEKADEILKAIEENQATCDGTGTAKIGRTMGVRFGFGRNSQGNENCPAGTGNGAGRNGGFGQRNGACLANNA